MEVVIGVAAQSGHGFLTGPFSKCGLESASVGCAPPLGIARERARGRGRRGRWWLEYLHGCTLGGSQGMPKDELEWA